MKKSTLALAGVGLVVSAALAPLALAQTFNGNAIYKITRSNGTPSIIVANRSPGQKVEVTFPNATTTRRVTANACGLIKLRDTSSKPLANLQTVDGETIDQATLPTQLLPRCTDGVIEEARTEHFKTGAGEVVLVKTPNTVYQAIYSGGKTARATVNACGFAKMNTTRSRDLTSAEYSAFQIDGTDYDISTVAEASPEPLCRSGNLYLPDAWP